MRDSCCMRTASEIHTWTGDVVYAYSLKLVSTTMKPPTLSSDPTVFAAPPHSRPARNVGQNSISEVLASGCISPSAHMCAATDCCSAVS